jgi:hypothetical protein
MFVPLTITKTPKFISVITNKFWCENPEAKKIIMLLTQA